MFSSRIPSDLESNRLAKAIETARRTGRPFVDLTLSNPTRAGIPYASDLLEPLGRSAGLTYAPEPLGISSARNAVAEDYARRHITVPPEHIVMTASTSEAYSLLFKLLADPGDEVLVPRPSYPLFEHLTRLDGVIARPYDLEYHGRWSVDVESVRSVLTPRTRALLVVNPNNPTGSFVSRRDLDALSGICAHGNVALIADEVFADYPLEVCDDDRLLSTLQHASVLTFALGGLSKSVGLPQLKVGWIAVAGPDAAVAGALARLELICDTYLSVSTPAQLALNDLLIRGTAVRDAIHTRVRSNYEWLRTVAREFPASSVLRVEGGWYAVLQVPAVVPEEELVVTMLEVDGVLAHPGFFFDFAREAFLIVSLLPPVDAFRDGVRRLLARAAPRLHEPRP